MRYLEITDIDAYNRAFGLSNFVWQVVLKWPDFAKRTMSGQFVRSVDSISANLAEGFNRYNKKDKTHFYIIAKGSVGEAKDWLEKGRSRLLIDENVYKNILEEINNLPREINQLIKFTNERLDK